MSGGSSTIAFVSSIAALFEALDTGCRLTQQVKEWLKLGYVQGSVEPWEALERNIQDSIRCIQMLIEKGTKRFGSSFEEGDGTAAGLPHRLDG